MQNSEQKSETHIQINFMAIPAICHSQRNGKMHANEFQFN